MTTAQTSTKKWSAARRLFDWVIYEIDEEEWLFRIEADQDIVKQIVAEHNLSCDGDATFPKTP